MDQISLHISVVAHSPQHSMQFGGVHRWWGVSIVSDCLGWVDGGQTRWGAEGVIRREIAGIDSGPRSRGGVSACKTYPICHSNALHQSSHLHEIEKRKRNEYEWAGQVPGEAFSHLSVQIPDSCSERSSIYHVEARLHPHALILSSTDLSIFCI